APATAVAGRGPRLARAAATKIRSGSDAVGATVAATDQFAALFEKMGGLQAERVTDCSTSATA
ncbi:hypothetical protein NJ76_15355, partial [Rhodococcus sp. IITR03]